MKLNSECLLISLDENEDNADESVFVGLTLLKNLDKCFGSYKFFKGQMRH